MAEWLGRALQKLAQRFESARCLQKLPEKGAFFMVLIEKINQRFPRGIGALDASKKLPEKGALFYDF